jgi:DNA-binding response OmpR family regulator
MSVRVSQSEARVPLILLIEDDANDVFLFRRVLAQMGYHCDVRVVDTTAEGKRYMLNEGEFKDPVYFRTPDLIVSDFRLAGHTSLEFVQWLRSQERFVTIPVIMLSGVVSGLDPALFVGLAVNTFLRKTADVRALATALLPLLPRPT